jgi:hypothetical protein
MKYILRKLVFLLCVVLGINQTLKLTTYNKDQRTLQLNNSQQSLIVFNDSAKYTYKYNNDSLKPDCKILFSWKPSNNNETFSMNIEMNLTNTNSTTKGYFINDTNVLTEVENIRNTFNINETLYHYSDMCFSNMTNIKDDITGQDVFSKRFSNIEMFQFPVFVSNYITQNGTFYKLEKSSYKKLIENFTIANDSIINDTSVDITNSSKADDIGTIILYNYTDNMEYNELQNSILIRDILAALNKYVISDPFVEYLNFKLNKTLSNYLFS